MFRVALPAIGAPWSPCLTSPLWTSLAIRDQASSEQKSGFAGLQNVKGPVGYQDLPLRLWGPSSRSL